jgi:hypothetical protein
MIVHEIPGTLLVEWNDEGKVTIDTWLSYTITAQQFREAILEKGVDNAKAQGGRAWVMDASKAKGAFPPEVQKLIETEVYKTFAKIGVKYFITIKSTSAVTNLSIKAYAVHGGPCGIQMVEVPDVSKAVAWLKEHP